ncbi:MAG: exodeoxyribonuclease VII small subunit [Lachnospiraceae bacterium]|jgi:exodeoxyribonuclease VII small subunit|nr:exodeoxyribonuclease VII small subunit [Lachnospiraceae bacterium]
MSTDNKEEFKLEAAFAEIEDIINKLDHDELPLKDSIDLYGKGAKLIVKCKEELSGIEKEMIVIGDTLSDEEEQ